MRTIVSGLTATNALSAYFSLASYRDGQKHEVIYENGEKVKDIVRKSSKSHGTKVSFSPSQRYLGKGAKISLKMLKEWIDSISYILPDRCRIKFEVMDGFDKVSSMKYKSRGIADLLKDRISATAEKRTKPVYLNINTELDDYVIDTSNIIAGKEKKVKRKLFLEVAFMYNDAPEPYIDSFCNYVNTTSGGTHINAVKEALWRYLTKKTTDTMSDREKEKYKILKSDVESGLNLVINLSTDMQVQFVGQTKNEVSNEDIVEPIKNLIGEALDAYFVENKDQLASVCKEIKLNCKGRVEASKVRTATVKGTVNRFDKYSSKKFYPCNNEGKKYKEFFLVEGDSAAGSILNARNADFQAILALRGVTANGFKRDESTILNNAEWNEYVKLLGTNFGSKFDISRLNYDKIIICTDSDIDGHGITSSICAFHALYLPELVKAGKLYKAVGPLYKLSAGNNKYIFVRDRAEYAEVYQDKIIKNFKVIVPQINKKDPIKTSVFKELILDTSDYLETITTMAEYFTIHIGLLERIAYFIIMNHVVKYDALDPRVCDVEFMFSDRKFRMNFVAYIQEKFPEIFLLDDKYILKGIADGSHQSRIINARFIRKIMDLRDIYETYGCELKAKEKDGDYNTLSLSEFMMRCSVYKNKIISRYKGLGEINKQDLWDTTLNPDTRFMYQLTMDDVERDLKIFKKLHGVSAEDVEARKEMFAKYKIRREDLDN